MPIPRYAAKRDSNENEIASFLEANGVSVTRISQRGVFDLACSFGERTCFVDTKAKYGTLTDSQTKWLRTWQGKTFVIKTIGEALAVVDWLKEL